MKKQIDSKTMAIVAGVAVLVLVIAGVLYFKPQIGPGPEVPVVPYAPPGSSGYGPGAASGNGAPSSAGGPGTPMGAPRDAKG